MEPKVVALPLLHYPELTLVLTCGPSIDGPKVLAWVEAGKRGRAVVMVEARADQCRVVEDEFDPEVHEVHVGTSIFLVARAESERAGCPPISRTLTRRPIKAGRSVHDEAKKVQPGVQARSS